MAFVDSTVYPPLDRPDEALSYLFAKHDLPVALRLHITSRKLRTPDLWMALGSTAASALRAIRNVCPDLPWSSSPADRRIEEITIQAIWVGALGLMKARADRAAKAANDPSTHPAIPESERALMRKRWEMDHPDLPLSVHTEPHPQFVDRIHRDLQSHHRLPCYRIHDFRVAGDAILGPSGFKRSIQGTLEITTEQDVVAISSAEDALNRIQAFYTALAFLQVMKVDQTSALGFLTDLRRHSRRHAGLDHVIKVDELFRRAIDNFLIDHPDTSFASAFQEIRLHQGWVWNSALVEVSIARAHNNHNLGIPGHRIRSPNRVSRDPSNLSKSARRRASLRRQIETSLRTPDDPVTDPSGSEIDSRARRDPSNRKRGSPHHEIPSGHSSGSGTKRVHPDEWIAIKAQAARSPLIGASKPCDFFNSSKGCNQGSRCRFAHVCFDCGGSHAWSTHHWQQ